VNKNTEIIFQTKQSPKGQISPKQPKPFQFVRTIAINNALITSKVESSTWTSRRWCTLKDGYMPPSQLQMSFIIKKYIYYCT